MRAVGLYQYLPIDHPEALLDVELPVPEPGPRDLRVAVRSISVNPVDVKVRAPKAQVEAQPRVLGWDAAGVVDAVGRDVRLFKPGDAVFYAGSIARPGSNAELQLVDERIVGRKPNKLSFAEAAALPLTALTAWELLFDRLRVPRGTDTSDAVLIIGAAGGVGSIATQLARRLTKLTVIGTASRRESTEWVRSMGAHHVVDHSRPLAEQVRALVGRGARYVLSLTATDRHWNDIAELIAPEGALGLIDDPREPLDLRALKQKSASVHWEFMFTRAIFETDEPLAQHRILNEVSELVETGVLRTTLTEELAPINAVNLKRAHAQLETGRTIGKLVLSGF
ncbi:MAG TPA: zinc-binding alcohol dehydrogenase family protein [Polyangiales bacterium]|nr:zinc-binding alcohol dehydrogenase family protein [Polyangiales bacterium]